MKENNLNIKSTFMHLPNIGKVKERDIWDSGVFTWCDYIEKKRIEEIFYDESNSILRPSIQALEEGDFDYFARLLPNNKLYRLALSKPEYVIFLDIETTGLSFYYDYITMIGWSINGEYKYYVSGISSDVEFLEDLRKAKVVVTFNGTNFDLPFLKQYFSDIRFPEAHIDLRYFSKGCELSGGQKLVEEKIGFKRSNSLQETDGFTATILWDEYKWGKKSSLLKLIRYNHSDVEGMKYILDYCIRYNFISEKYCRFFKKPYQFSSLKSKFYKEEVSSFVKNNEIPFDKKSVLSFQALSNKIKKDFKVVGVDLTGSEEKASGIASLDNQKVNTCLLKKDSEIIDFIREFSPDVVSIDSPLSLPEGRKTPYDNDPLREKYGIMRICERTLKKRGVNVYPALIPSMQKLTARGIRLAKELRKLGIPVIESYPGVVQDIIGLPRKQASLVLLKKGLGIFGLKGRFLNNPVTHDELDAITSAIVGVFFISNNFEAIGSMSENFMIIPDLNVSYGERLILGISGNICSGKTTVAKSIERKGFFYIRYSEILERKLKESKKNVTRKDLQEIGAFYQKKQYELCKAVHEKIKDKKFVVIDGLRNLEDYTYWRETYGLDFKLIYIDVDEEERERRYFFQDAEQDYIKVRESITELGIEKLSLCADEIVMNNEEMHELFKTLEKVLKKYGA